MGNTTKAETKGIAIGSAVIAAVSLFASFIAVIAVKSEDKIGEMTIAQYYAEAGKLSIAYPEVFVGALIGGAVPFLFSSMLIRAVGRAAFLIVKECRVQFRDKEIWAGTKKPDYGRVVNICTAAAQSELIGPALLAILMPILVGIFLGTQALGGYLAGMIVVGQLLAVFMANAGGAWDNAKKMIEDGHLRRQGLRGPQGRRHRRHRRRPAEGHRRPGAEPADQGHEHGRPALDRADPRFQGEGLDLALRGRRAVHRSASPGPSGGARPRARSSARWRPSWPAPPSQPRASKPSGPIDRRLTKGGRRVQFPPPPLWALARIRKCFSLFLFTSCWSGSGMRISNPYRMIIS